MSLKLFHHLRLLIIIFSINNIICNTKVTETLLRVNPVQYFDFDYNVTSRDVVCVANNAKPVFQIHITHKYFHYFPRNFFQCTRGARYMVIWTSALRDLEENDFEDNELVELEINDLNMTELRANVFRKLTSLTYLLINSNFITSVNENAFNGLIALNHLSLECPNLIKMFPNLLFSLHNLELLSLDIEKVTEMDENIFKNNKHLNEIHLKTQLRYLHHNIFNNQNSELFLSIDNNDVALSFEIPRVVKYIYLQNTPVDYIELKNANLLTISLNNCGLTNLTILQNQHDLKKFISIKNNIENINSTIFNNLTKLSALKIQQSGLKNIECNAFSENKRLCYLTLDVDNINICVFGDSADNLRSIGLSDSIFRDVMQRLRPIAQRLDGKNLKCNSIIWHDRFKMFYGFDDPFYL